MNKLILKWLNKSLYGKKLSRKINFKAFNYPQHLSLKAINEEILIHYKKTESQGFRFISDRSEGKIELTITGPIKNKQLLIEKLEAYLKKRAKKFFLPLCEEAAENIGVSFNRLAIRGQKTRWGSCSSKGNINLNYKLLFLTQEQLNYVIYHELVHRLHFDHSPLFWKTLAQYIDSPKVYDHVLRRMPSTRPF